MSVRHTKKGGFLKGNFYKGEKSIATHTHILYDNSAAVD